METAARKRVVLVRPSGPRNVGMVLRAAVNFGPCDLWLVAPERASLLVHPEFEQMSHGVERARERCRVTAELSEALADCTLAVGFTARSREKRRRRTWPEVRPEIAARLADPSERVALVFGNESTGLSGAESAALQELVHIPTSAEHTSINLALAVGIVLAALAEGAHEAARERGGRALSGDAREFLKASLKDVLGRVVYTSAARRDVLAMVDRVFSRAPLESRDARAWHIVLRTLGHERTPGDFGLEVHEKRGRRKRAVAEAIEKKVRRKPEA